MPKTRSRFEIYRGGGKPRKITLPEGPPWRKPGRDRADGFVATEEMKRMVNAALHLCKPLLVSGDPGTGKTSLIYHVANELGLGEVLRWNIHSRTKMLDGLYRYDAIGRLDNERRDKSIGIEDFLWLGPVGTALASSTRRALLVDEIDKSDPDLPNDLLNVLEDGSFRIPQLSWENKPDIEISGHDGERYEVKGAEVETSRFPFIILTSNGERAFPAAFRRRCLCLHLERPDRSQLERILDSHLGDGTSDSAQIVPLLDSFTEKLQNTEVNHSVDQLLNAAQILLNAKCSPNELKDILDILQEPY